MARWPLIPLHWAKDTACACVCGGMVSKYEDKLKLQNDEHYHNELMTMD